MEQVILNGQNSAFPNVSASLARLDVTGLGATIDLNSGLSNCSMLLVSGVGGAPVVACVVGVQAHKSVDFTPVPNPTAFGPALTKNSWITVIKNDTRGGLAISGTLNDGTVSASHLVPAGTCALLCFDGTNAPYVLT